MGWMARAACISLAGRCQRAALQAARLAFAATTPTATAGGGFTPVVSLALLLGPGTVFAASHVLSRCPILSWCFIRAANRPARAFERAFDTVHGRSNCRRLAAAGRFWKRRARRRSTIRRCGHGICTAARAIVRALSAAGTAALALARRTGMLADILYIRASCIRACALVDAMRNSCGRRLAAPLGLSATAGFLIRSPCC